MSRFRASLLSIRSPEEANNLLASVSVDPGGIGMMAAKMQTCCIRIYDVECRQANILKQEMLSIGGDCAVARGTVACSIPKTDIIIIGTKKQLHMLCQKLKLQPFGLPTLAPTIVDLIANADKHPKYWQTSKSHIPLDRPLIMGILNVTPDSFSDGNRFFEPKLAVERAMLMVEQGADILDIGGESTRPGAEPVSSAEELKRLIPVIAAIKESGVKCPISVDTWKSTVASETIAAGAEIINDITGCTLDPEMANVAAKNRVALVLMHTRGTPQNMQSFANYDNFIDEVIFELSQRIDAAVLAGVDKNCIAIDPGIGFAKNATHNLEILRKMSDFKQLGLPILVGSSRKSFIGAVLDKKVHDRLYGTAATVAISIAAGAHIVRVHDVSEMRDVVDMSHAIFCANFNSE